MTSQTVRLTKTERELLEKAARKPHGTLYAMTWWSSSSRHMTNHGGRAAAALKSLVHKGLADNYRAESNNRANSDQFGSTYATEFSARITDAGRKALEA